MKKILVPIDNSKVSKGAALYAVQLAKNLKAQVILLSVINATSTSSTLASWQLLEKQMVAKEQKDAARMMADIRKQTGSDVKIFHKVVLGFPVEEMVNIFIRENGINFVVMGTSGARGLKKVLSGSNTASVIDISTVPVIAVPKGGSPGKVNKIVYATDMAHLDEEIKSITHFARLFGAQIEILHVASDYHPTRSHKNLEALLIRMAKYPKIRFIDIEEADIAKGISKFVAKSKADMLAMFTHKLGFFEKVLGKSITRSLAFHTPVPLLAFNRSNS